MYGLSTAVTWLGVIGAVLLLVALGLFAAPLAAVLFALLVAGVVIAAMVIRRARNVVADPGTGPARGVTPEGQATGVTGRASGEPASGEG